MSVRYKKPTNEEQIECFEAHEVISKFKEVINNFKAEHDEKLESQEKLTFLEETNKIYKERIQQNQQKQQPIIVGGGDKQLNDFMNQIAEIKMKRCNITENDLIEHRKKILKDLENYN